MKKTQVVVFDKTNARILTNPSPADLYGKHHLAVVTRDFVDVEHVPTHFWKLSGRKIVEMSKEEKEKRLSLMALYTRLDTINKSITKNEYADDFIALNEKIDGAIEAVHSIKTARNNFEPKVFYKHIKLSQYFGALLFAWMLLITLHPIR